jgi:opacity protein-like surface antigen
MKIGWLVAVASLLSISAIAVHAQIGVDVGLSGAGVFTKTTNSSTSGISDSATKSAAVIGTIGYHFKPRHGVQLNFGHTKNSQIFSVPPDTYRVMTGITEFTGAYVFTPFPDAKWEPFLLAGGGGLRFSVGKTYIDTIQGSFGTTGQTSLAFLYGAGVDYRIFSHLGLRLQYRGLVFRNPDFGVPSRFYTGAKSHMAEPAIGIVVKF